MDYAEFVSRLNQHYDELKWLYCELYQNDMMAFRYFVDMLRRSYTDRKQELRDLDHERLADPEWFRSNRMLGMMLYVDNFAGDLQGVRVRLPYLQECGINYLHLMPLLRTVKGRSDGGYAVADFREVQPELGTMADLEALSDDCRQAGISLALDFVMNHTSEDHEWARAARAGDPVAAARYFFYDNRDIPDQFEKTVPQVFPTTAPGNFTYLEDCGRYVMTSFYPYQWDLNYANPMVFNDMTENLLYLANRGMDVIRLDAIPYIWKELGTDCRNLPQVHTLSRLIRMACEIVCPGVLLLGEVVMEPAKVAPYFGTREKPECHLLYNVTTMCSTWSCLATHDVRLLMRQMDQLSALPRSYSFQNYLRCHDDIGWGLDYPWLEQFGVKEVAHKKYLNDWFTGKWPGSRSRGELYNDDPTLGDARLCGTTASLCGMEVDEELGFLADRMLHAWMFTQSGIPVLYSGDEIAQENDYSYHDDPDKCEDSRYLHRGRFDWALARKRHDPGTIQGRVFEMLRQLETIRASQPVFCADAAFFAFPTGSDRVLGIRREREGDRLTALFNFSEEPVTLHLEGEEASDLISGRKLDLTNVELPEFGFLWALSRTD
ncbi:MAG: Beta-galactosidase C-terminal domain [Firmicutes bacterium]|nr:Beta-galactosidase C-terminal domain [Bacillota bacterium]